MQTSKYKKRYPGISVINSSLIWYIFFSSSIIIVANTVSEKKNRFVCCGFAHGEPASPISESLAIIELSSHSSGEGTSDSGAPELDGD